MHVFILWFYIILMYVEIELLYFSIFLSKNRTFSCEKSQNLNLLVWKVWKSTLWIGFPYFEVVWVIPNKS